MHAARRAHAGRHLRPVFGDGTARGADLRGRRRSLTVTFRAAADQSGYALYSWFDGQTQYCLIVQSDAAQPEASQALLEDVLPGCTQPSE